MNKRMQRVSKEAHRLKKQGFSWKEAMKKAWAREKKRESILSLSVTYKLSLITPEDKTFWEKEAQKDAETRKEVDALLAKLWGTKEPA